MGKRLMLEPLEQRTLLTAYLVTNAGDSNSGTGTSGTLRYVLSQLDSSGGATNTINFFLGTAQQTITPGSALPTITKQVDIIGGTVSGTSEPLVVINGGSDNTIALGLDLESGSSGSRIQNLVIDGFDAYGIEDESADDSVTGCYIGTNGAGTAAVPNAQVGIEVEGSGTTIGGTTAGSANVISGNGDYGIEVGAPCLVEGNFIGTNAAGSAAVPNGDYGIDVYASGATIGGTTAGSANVISGNGEYGIYVDASCLVEGNDIGTNAAGTASLPNSFDGIDVKAPGATIGGTTAGSTNVISGNSDGIGVNASCLVEGNEIGTNLAGSAAVPNFGYGIEVYAPGATIGGTTAGSTNVISGNGLYGIYVGASCLVEGNKIGTDAAGTAAVPNTPDGIDIEEPGATIGGTTAGSTNVISGNGTDGIYVGAPCLVAGNDIGTNAAGTAAVANSSYGIDVEVPGATIGGTTAGSTNVISGNGIDGIYVGASCLVEGNDIGTNAAGTAAVPNAYAGSEVAASAATIGGTTVGSTNVISGNGEYGIRVEASSLVEGNDIGTNAAGTAAVPNAYYGVSVVAQGATIGGTTAGSTNVISGNGNGIATDASCLVEGNFVGTNAAGTGAIPNTNSGVVIFSSGATIGGSTAGSTNVISGNRSDGIYVGASCLVEGNDIGTNAKGAPVPNTLDGIDVEAPGAIIGGSTAGSTNFISGNGTNGIFLKASCLVEGNAIGTNAAGTAVPNASSGIDVDASGAKIGAAGAGNIIAFNFGPGVTTNPGITGSTIRFNSIFSNTGPGIDLNDDGVTPNAPNGANNTPVLTSVSGVLIAGTLDASPDSTYTIDFYANSSSDASAARPQGRTELGSMTVKTNAQGTAAIAFPYAPIADEPFVTATSTDASGTTSDFSPPFYAVTVSGLTFNATVGVPFSGQVASFTSSDPAATAADFTATINFGDGTPSAAGTVVAAPGGFVVTGIHTFTTANPAVPVTVTITTTLDPDQVTANSLADVSGQSGRLAPSSGSGPSPASTVALAMLAENIKLSPSGSFHGVVATLTDSGPAEPASEYKATINWGKGRRSAGMVTGSNGRFVVSGRHVFPRFKGTKAVTVTVTNEVDGQSASVSDPVTWRKPGRFVTM
jgi:hypothetical protein